MEIGGIILFVVVVLIIAAWRNKKVRASSAEVVADRARSEEYLNAERANVSLGVCKVCGAPMDEKEFSGPYRVLLVCTSEQCAHRKEKDSMCIV